MGRKATALLAAVFAASLGGCGTVANCVGWDSPAPREIYGGVKQDLQNGTGHLNEALNGPVPTFSAYPQPPAQGKQVMARSFCAACGVGMLAVDLPVSIVTDTLTLPLTVSSSMLNQKTNSQRKTPKKAQNISSMKPPA